MQSISNGLLIHTAIGQRSFLSPIKGIYSYYKSSQKENSTALHIAAWKGEGDALTTLLEYGADPNVANVSIRQM